jgi:ligand-binding sensor domain-containing protein
MSMKHRKPLLAWLFLWLVTLVFPVKAQTPGITDSPFIVDAWTSKDGLPENAVISVIQTRDGYLWIGTLNGLVRFDGNRFTVFNEYNTPGLNSDRIVYLFEDSHTNLWIGTDTAEVALVQDGKVKKIDLGRAGHEGRLVSACEDATGAVWLYTADAQLGRYQDGKLETLNLNISYPPICRMLIAEKSGPLWLGEYGIGEPWGQLLSFRPGNFHPPALSFDQQFRVEKLDFILASQRGGTWRLVNGRVEKWGITQREKDWGAYPWGNAPVTSACEDKAGNLIVGTLGQGIFWYDAGGKYQQISTDQGLSLASVLSLCMDREGELWVGTDGGGLDRIKGKVFHTPEELHPWVAQSIAEDAQGGLWVTFGAYGASYWKTNAVKDFHVGRYQNAWTVLVDHQQLGRGPVSTTHQRVSAGHRQHQPRPPHLCPVRRSPGTFMEWNAEWPGGAKRGGLENLHNQQRPLGKYCAGPGRERGGRSLDRHRESRLGSVQAWPIYFLSRR